MASQVFGNPWAVRIKGPLDEGVGCATPSSRCASATRGRRTGYEPGPDGRFTRFVELTARPQIRTVNMVGTPAAEVRKRVRSWFFEPGDLDPGVPHAFPDHPDSRGRAPHREQSSPRGQRRRDPSRRDLRGHRQLRWPRTVGPGGPVQRRLGLGLEQFAGLSRGRGLLAEIPGRRRGGGRDARRWRRCLRRRVGGSRVPAAAARTGRRRSLGRQGGRGFGIHLLLRRRAGAAHPADRPRSGLFDVSKQRPPGRAGLGGRARRLRMANGLVLATRIDQAESIADLATRLRVEIREALVHEAYPYHHVIRGRLLRPHFGVNWYPDGCFFQDCPGLEIFQPDMDFGTWEYDLNIRFVRHIALGAPRRRHPFPGRTFLAAQGRRGHRTVCGAAGGLLRRHGGPHRRGHLAEPGRTGPARRSGGGAAGRWRRTDSRGLPAPGPRASPEAVAIEHVNGRWTYGESGATFASPGGSAASGGRGSRRPRGHRGRSDAAAGVRDAGHRPGRRGVRRPGRRLSAVAARSPHRPGRPEGDVGRRGLSRRRSGPQPGGFARDPHRRPAQGWDGRPAHRPGRRFSRRPRLHPLHLRQHRRAQGGRLFASPAQPVHGLARGRPTRDLRPDRSSPASSPGCLHDPLLREVFTPLSLGATICIPDPETIQTPGALARWFRKAGIMIAQP